MRKILVLTFILIVNLGLCQDNRIEQPVKNFDRLWNVFNDRYANFVLKNIDWNIIYQKYRPLINNKTSNDSLFKVFNQMLLELEDGHVNLIQYGKKGRIINKSDDGSPSNFLEKFPLSLDQEPNINQLLKTTDLTLKDLGFSRIGVSKKGSIEYFKSEEYGYLRVLSMGNLPLRKYKQHLNEALDTFQGLKGVIIDVRFNGGGDDKVSFAIANRFTDRKRVGHYKQERIKSSPNFKKSKTKYLEPAGDTQFTGSIIILTSDLTASAAEVFTMIMKELPYVTIIGDNTNGIFSDMFNFKLPNGWLATLSHQQYFSPDRRNYEGEGIGPDIKLLNNHQDISQGIDPLIIRSVEVLDKNN